MSYSITYKKKETKKKKKKKEEEVATKWFEKN